MRRIPSIVFAPLLFVTLLHTCVYASESKGGKDSLKVKKRATDDFYTFFDGNRIVRWISNNGDGSFDPNTGVAGLYWPKGTHNTAVYEDGILYGGFVHGATVTTPELRVIGSTYRHAFQAGRIIGSGANAYADDPQKEEYRVFKIQKDFRKYKGSGGDVYTALRKDYLEWPGDQGAPYIDRNGNGVFDPPVLDNDDKLINGDEPYFIGDQVLWHVSNDLNAAKTKFVYGSNPMGMEIQRLMWGYNMSSPMGDSWFEKWTFINKGSFTVDSMFIGIWADVDLGGGAKDFNGCDTALQLGYAWNGGDASAGGPYSTPIACGYVLLQGPKVPGSPADTAVLNSRRVPGFRNLRMSSFAFYIDGSSVFRDPEFSYNGAVQFYRYLNGLVWDGSQYIDPATGQATKFPLSGDPVTNTGWVDGKYYPSDRRQLISTGPFRMAPGDTQEVIVGFNVSQGKNKYESVTLLKRAIPLLRVVNDLNFLLPAAPPQPKVNVTELADKIILDWSDPTASASTENYVLPTPLVPYRFEGYNVYQLPFLGASKSEALRVATFDLIDSIKLSATDVFDSTLGMVVPRVTQFGRDSGIKRYFVVDHDYLKNDRLIKGRRYYFAVTAYSYSPIAIFSTRDFENPVDEKTTYTAIPQDPKPGTKYLDTPLSDFPMMCAAGTATATVSAFLIDPSKTTGSNYDVVFEQSGTKEIVYTSFGTRAPLDTLKNVPVVDRFSVIRATTGDTIIPHSTDLKGGSASPIADGIQFRVSGVPTFVQNEEIRAVTYSPLANLNLSPLITKQGPVGLSDHEGWMPATAWADGLFLKSGRRIGLESYKDTLTVEIRFADPADTINKRGWSKGYGYLAAFQRNLAAYTDGVDPHRDWSGQEHTNHWWYLQDTLAGYFYTGYWDSPLSVWDVTDSTNSRQLSWAFWEQDSIHNATVQTISTASTQIYRDRRGPNPALNDTSGYTWSVPRFFTFPAGDTVLYGNTARNPNWNIRFVSFWNTGQLNVQNALTIIDAPYVNIPNPAWTRSYHLGYFDALAQDTNALQVDFDRKGPGKMPAAYTGHLCLFSAARPVWKSGDVMRVIPNRPLTTSSRFHFDASAMPKGAITGNLDLAKQQVKQVNVFPNPYFGQNAAETSKYFRFVTFSHLPHKATIRIFTLAGIHVRTIKKDDSSQFAQWDLTNENNIFVSSGMYIVYVDMENLGVKVLKLAIVMGAQFLDRI